jgi:hypothetical protein
MFPGGTAEEANDGDLPNGGHGPLNSTIGPDNVPCLQAMYPGGVGKPGDGYHVHPFLGIYFNGRRVALPDGIGMSDPAADFTFNGIPNWTNFNANGANGCFYQIHTHDASGVFHIESYPPAPPGGFNGQQGTLYTLGDLLAVWGVSAGPSNFGPLNGTVTIYTSGPVSRGGPGTKTLVPSTTYQLICTACDSNTIGSIPLYSHEVIWVLVGTGNLTGSSLPNINFFTEW